MSFHRLLLSVFVATSIGIASPSPAAGVNFWSPCSGAKAKAEGRSVDIRSYLRVRTTGMKISDIEDLYCVTPIKCVVLGHCKAASPEQQAEADKLRREIAAEEARLQRERAIKAAAAQRAQELERQRTETERRRKDAELAVEKARRARLMTAEAQRLKLSAQEAQRLVDAREDARRKMPPQPEKCTVDYAAYTQKVDMTPVIMLQAQAEKDYAGLDRAKLCNGRPGKLDPLKCDKPANLFGFKLANCSTSVHCPAYQETKACARASAQ